MTNKPMLSVERDLIERAVQAIINTSQMQPALNELRALLDKPAAESDGVNWKAVATEQMAIIQELKAAQHKGGPVAMIKEIIEHPRRS